MDTPHGRIRLYAFGGALWAVTIVYTYRSVAHMGGEIWLFLLFAAMIATFTALRVRLGTAEMSAAGLVAQLAVPAMGPAMAAMTESFCAIGVALEPKDHGRLRTVGVHLLVPIPVFMVMVRISGAVYAAMSGPVGARPSASGHWLVPFFVMEICFHVSNVLLMALQRSVAELRSPIGFAMDIFRRFYPSQVIFTVVGVVMQSLYFQLGPFSLLIALALLLLVRAALRVHADNQAVQTEMAQTLAQALSLRDPYTGGHSQRVATLAAAAGRVLGMNDTQIERLRDSALLHDIGKVAVPDAVLRKPGPLDPDEWRSMDVHADAGGDLLAQSPHLRHLASLVRNHHGGQTHEQGPAPETDVVPFEARLIAVADAFDAMTTDRPYRRALPLDEAIRRLRAGAGTQFDPQAVAALLKAVAGSAAGPPLPGGLEGGSTPPQLRAPAAPTDQTPQLDAAPTR